MTGPPLLRLAPSAVLKERRLAALLAGRDPRDAALVELVQDVQILGSLELASAPATWEAVQASRRGEPRSAEIEALRRARGVVPPEAPLSVDAVLAWHAALFPGAGLRTAERSRSDAPPPAPPGFVRGRLGILAEWLASESARELAPPQLGALALARVVEILPFHDGNGRVSRLAASHAMVRAGARPPILVGADGPRLVQCLQAAFRLETEPLTALLAEASERALDVMTQALERGLE